MNGTALAWLPRWRQWLPLCSVGLALAIGPCWSAAQTPAGGATVRPPDAAQWLQRIQVAASSRSYQGTIVVSGGGVVSSARVVHIADGQQRYERIEALDGKARLQFRHNDQLLTLWPATKVAVAEQRDPVVDFPALPGSAAQRAVDNYELRTLGNERIAGHQATVVQVKPRDAWRYAQRWWVERDSGLLLRSDLLGANGEVLDSSTFSDIDLAPKASPELVLGPMRRLDGWRLIRQSAVRVHLDNEGWQVVGGVAGFQLVSCSKRVLDAAAVDGGLPEVLQAVFSDGLTHVSVFVERYDARRHKSAVRTTLGATQTLTGQRGDWWMTVIGEVPMATAQQFAAAVVRKP